MARYRLCIALISLLAMSVQAQDTDIERGARLLMPFKQSLQDALREGLSVNPVHAIGICQIRAPDIAGALSRDSVKVGRSSQRLRNPANITPGWADPVLDEYLAKDDEREPQAVALPGDRVGYVEPITMQPMCVTCHGETLAPNIAESIQALYPEDQATGFEVGDLRGIFWIEFPRVQP